MLIKFTPQGGAHMKVVPLVAIPEVTENIAVTRKQVQLLPGTNEVTDDEWLVMKPHLKGEIEAGIVTPLAQNVTARNGDKIRAKNLVEFPVAVAVRFVSDCIDPDTLQKWYKEEGRDEVRVRIARRMEKLKVDPPDEELSLRGDDNDDGDPLDDKEDYDVHDADSDGVDYTKMKYKQLVKIAKNKGIDTSGLETKQAVIDALEMV
jgi:hypothetical protein